MQMKKSKDKVQKQDLHHDKSSTTTDCSGMYNTIRAMDTGLQGIIPDCHQRSW